MITILRVFSFSVDDSNRGISINIGVTENLNTLIKLLGVQFEGASETLSKSLLDLLGGSKALEFTIYLNCHLGTKSLSFFH